MTFYQMGQALCPFFLLALFYFFYRLNRLEQRVLTLSIQCQALQKTLTSLDDDEAPDAEPAPNFPDAKEGETA